VSINRNALKNYAPKARQDFIAAVTARAAKFGITDGEPVPMQEQGDVVIIGGEAFPKTIGAQRKALLGRIHLHGFGQTMEEVAYTWFNRFLAIRYMELHGYLDHGFRVLSNPDGSSNSEIVQSAGSLELVGLDNAQVDEFLMDGTKDAELYRLLLIAQCNALHDAMPFLFEKIDDETELLLPDNLLHTDSLIRQLVTEIDEADWQEIEIIGWLYQFYISEKKDQVIGKVVMSEDIPAATQLFTPNWIVKYMVQNSLGHQWMATYPTSSLKEGMDYYIEPAKQTPEVRAQLAEITPEELNPEELTLLDPAVGSGHILVEAYDLFKQIYLERGYRLKDIPRLILEKNLYGLDIDDRAAQMAGFALLMKARADDRRILSNPVHLNVIAIQSSEGLDAADIAKQLLPSGRYELVASDDLLPETLAQPTLAANVTSEVKAGTIESLINLFEDAKTFGSLITVPDNIRKALPALGQLLDQPSSGDLLQRQMREHAVEALWPLVAQVKILGRQYDCVVANPPYMGGRGMFKKLKTFTENYFEAAKSELFTCFVDRGFSLIKKGGYNSMVTMEVWMFLSSFETFRKHLLDNRSILSLAHFPYDGHSPTAMGINFGISVFSIKNIKIRNYQTHFCCSRHFELDQNGKPKHFPTQNERNRFVNSDVFNDVPGATVPYWVGANTIKAFRNGALLGDIAEARQGLATANNDRFLRHWAEIDFRKLNTSAKSRNTALESNQKWFPYNKGGDYRKWYGNREFVVNWENDGHEIRNFFDKNGKLRSRPQNTEFFFREGATWSFISSSYFGVRWTPSGCIFDVGGSSIFPPKDKISVVVALLTSNLAHHFLKAVNPTLNFQVGNVGSIPFLESEISGISNEISSAFNMATNLAVKDWDSYETSWDFQTVPLLSSGLTKANVQSSYEAWEDHCQSSIQTMKELEERNNTLFIEAYGLQDELTPDVPEKLITLARADREEDIKRLISYAIGCMMGRYSLAAEGLVYANRGNQDFDPSRYCNFPADDDGIVPITDAEWFDDDATVRFVDFLKLAWSPETLKENLKFIGDSLANNGGNDPLKAIRNYLSKGFYKDHLKTYKKRPIYWLFSSGKQRAFECLVYLHRYNEGTLARMRMEYVTPLQSRMSARIDQLGGDVEAASSTPERNRKQKERDKLVEQLEELLAFDEELRHYADQRITLDLDDGVKVNYDKFGSLLAETKAITGKT
jgi:type II restriction/modification system DNA methylase subunit YeeA